MNNNLKLRISLISLFIIVYSILFFTLNNDKNNRINYILNKSITDLKTQQLIIDNYFKNDAALIKDRITKNNKIITILSKTIDSSKEKKDNLRKLLLKELKPLYKKLKRRGILQLHFVSTNNITILRVHKPNKYNDDLTGIRYSYGLVNKEKKVITGFEQGKSAHGYRYVFPIFNKQKVHIASAEISLNTDFIQTKLSKLNKIHTHFIVNKTIFDERKWKSEKLLNKYIQAIEHKNYMYSIVDDIYDKEVYIKEKSIIKSVKAKIATNFNLKKAFAVDINLEDTTKVITFIPVKNIKDKSIVAYLVSYADNYILHEIYKHFYYKIVLAFLILLFIVFIIYKGKLNDIILLNKSNKITSELKKQIDAFDKNVIFSKTDLKGIITHVSEAFCKVSGYTEDELIGKPHNIIRHMDMKDDTFKELWKTLKLGKTWSGQVKNKKKNGDYYWVLSTIELDYDDNGKHIGYYAIRHIITAQKKVEELKLKLEDINTNLEQEVTKRVGEIVLLNTEIKDTQKEVVFTMGAIGESRSKETGNHVKRVAQYSKILALHYGLPQEDAEMLKQASPMHDIGKVGISDSILNKPGRFDDSEREIMNTHAYLGYDMLKHSQRPLLKMAATVALEHHERWDGKGYPNGLKAEEISIYGRITSLSDVFDALGSDRVYKQAWDDEKIFKLFHDERGKQFDPKLVDIFFNNIDEFLTIRDSLKD